MTAGPPGPGKRPSGARGVQRAVEAILAESPTLTVATPRLLEAIGTELGWVYGALWEVEPRGQALVLVEIWHAAEADASRFEELGRWTRFAPGVGLPGQVWAADEPRWVSDMAEGQRYPRAMVAAEAGLHGAICFPVAGEHGVLGIMEFFAARVTDPDPVLLESMAAVGGQIGRYIEHRRAQDSVGASEARMRAMLDSSLDCIVSMDHRGRIVEFNPAAERTFGHRREDVVGELLGELIVPPSMRQAHRDGLARYLKTGEGPVLRRRFEITAVRADGEEFPVELTITPIDIAGPPVFTGYIRDITDRKAAEEDRERILELERVARIRAQAAERRAAFLAHAGAVLGGSLDSRALLEKVAELTVPDLADWCVVDMLTEGGSIERVAVAHVDPVKRELPFELARRYPADPQEPGGAAEIIRTGRSELLSEMPDELLGALAHDEEHLRILREVGMASAIGVPLVARGRVLGAMALVSADPERRYDQEDLALAEDLAARAGAAVDNARLFHERSRIARTLQESLLPPVLPEIAGWQMGARYRPAAKHSDVGGDFYDLFETGQGSWALVIGDVAGKGASAARVTGLARYTLRAAAMRENEPSRILATLNDALLRQHGVEELCTAVFARLGATGEGASLLLANAGHPLPQLVRADGTVEVAGTSGTMLGVAEGSPASDTEILLRPGDTAVFFTDGVLDAHAPEVHMGPEELQSLLSGCAELTPALAAEHIERTVASAGQGRPRDDMAILVARWVGPAGAETAEPELATLLEGR